MLRYMVGREFTDLKKSQKVDFSQSMGSMNNEPFSTLSLMQALAFDQSHAKSISDVSIRCRYPRVGLHY